MLRQIPPDLSWLLFRLTFYSFFYVLSSSLCFLNLMFHISCYILDQDNDFSNCLWCRLQLSMNDAERTFSTSWKLFLQMWYVWLSFLKIKDYCLDYRLLLQSLQSSVCKNDLIWSARYCCIQHFSVLIICWHLAENTQWSLTSVEVIRILGCILKKEH